MKCKKKNVLSNFYHRIGAELDWNLKFLLTSSMNINVSLFCLSLFLSVSLSVYQLDCPYPISCLSFLTICLSFYLSICLIVLILSRVCLSFYLSICLIVLILSRVCLSLRFVLLLFICMSVPFLSSVSLYA